MEKYVKNNKGFTLVELILTVVIAGILATIAFRSLAVIEENAKIEETKEELNELAFAIIGNEELYNNGIRADYGYVGDIGALPVNLDNLYSNPGGYANWKGPYTKNRFVQTPNDFKQDAWGVNYSYNGVAITSTGSGTSIVRQLANNTSEILYNTISGNIFDSDGTPPGIYNDSISICLTYPNGAGAFTLKSVIPDRGGYFTFDSIPIGNHQLYIVYKPLSDTLNRFVSVSPNAEIYSEYYFASNLWYASSGGIGGLVFVNNSDTLTSSAKCNNLDFWIENTTGRDIVVSSMILSWSSPAAYYQKLLWNGVEVYNGSSSGKGSGEITLFSSPITFYNDTQVKISNLLFKTNPGSGSPVDMSNTEFTVTLSDGSTFTVQADLCTN